MSADKVHQLAQQMVESIRGGGGAGPRAAAVTTTTAAAAAGGGGDVDLFTQCLKELANNSRKVVSLLRIVLDRLEESIPCEPNLQSIMTDRRLLTRITGFLFPSESFGVIPRVCRVWAADVKHFLGFLAPYYMSRESSLKHLGMVKLVDLTFARGVDSAAFASSEVGGVRNNGSKRPVVDENIENNEEELESEDDLEFGDESSDGDLESARDPNNPEASPKSKLHFFKSEIECGVVENGKILYSIFSDYFGRYVDVFTAVADPQKRHLFRASTLAAKLRCKTNKVGMYLARRREFQDDIYQATVLRRKPMGATGLKAGGYFISLNACKKYEEHFSGGRSKSSGQLPRKRKLDELCENESDGSKSPLPDDEIGDSGEANVQDQLPVVDRSGDVEAANALISFESNMVAPPISHIASVMPPYQEAPPLPIAQPSDVSVHSGVSHKSEHNQVNHQDPVAGPVNPMDNPGLLPPGGSLPGIPHFSNGPGIHQLPDPRLSRPPHPSALLAQADNIVIPLAKKSKISPSQTGGSPTAPGGVQSFPPQQGRPPHMQQMPQPPHQQPWGPQGMPPQNYPQGHPSQFNPHQMNPDFGYPSHPNFHPNAVHHPYVQYYQGSRLPGPAPGPGPSHQAMAVRHSMPQPMPQHMPPQVYDQQFMMMQQYQQQQRIEHAREMQAKAAQAAQQAGGQQGMPPQSHPSQGQIMHGMQIHPQQGYQHSQTMGFPRMAPQQMPSGMHPSQMGSVGQQSGPPPQQLGMPPQAQQMQHPSQMHPGAPSSQMAGMQQQVNGHPQGQVPEDGQGFQRQYGQFPLNFQSGGHPQQR
eukprot:TRINITY_DN8408_c0_g1_i1.p1 TRINITY_DN8408_c0_g1~~TRINITY_DN8408_c0_g1_i1.p1  ORF type:complete len:813 (+),score=182.54 TRINITY_DN8408_c0_g1_i1:54-2492(+)